MHQSCLSLRQSFLMHHRDSDAGRCFHFGLKVYLDPGLIGVRMVGTRKRHHIDAKLDVRDEMSTLISFG